MINLLVNLKLIILKFKHEIMSKPILYSLIVILIAGCNPTDKQEQITEVPSYTIEQFLESTNIFGSSFSPDENKLLATSNESGIYNLVSLSADGSGDNSLTSSDSTSLFAISYFPNDERILFSADQDGDEIDHIYLLDTSGIATDLTPYEGGKSNFFGWSRDLNSFLFTSNQRDSRFFDLYEMDLETFTADMLYQNDEGYSISELSHDKNLLVLTKNITTSNNEMYLYNMTTQDMLHISEHDSSATYNPAFFTLDDQSLFFMTNEGSEFTYLSKYDIESGKKEKVFETNWNVAYAYNSYNEKYRVIGINEDGRTKLRMVELATDEKVELPDLNGGEVTSVSISRGENKMRLSVSDSRTPSKMVIYDLEQDKLTELTNTLNPEIDPKFLVDAKVIRFESFDGLQIPSIFYKPHQATSENPAPAMLWIHGGPGGQSRAGYSPIIQYIVNQGYAVLAVNNRGSSGYGKSFYQMDDQKHGDVDLKDCIWSKKYLSKLDFIDSTKIGIMGGSYGGYMTMAALTFAPEEFEVGVNIFGVTNWLRTLKSIPPYWESFREALYQEMGDPFTEDSLRLYDISPLFHADQVTKPLMVLQGANDPRVLQVESDEIVEAVNQNNVPVEYVLFPDEGHGFVKKENQIKGYKKIVEFLDKYLRKENPDINQEISS